MLKAVVLLNIFVETVIHFIFQDSQMNRKFKKNSIYYKLKSFVRLLMFFTVTFDQFNAFLMNKSINTSI